MMTFKMAKNMMTLLAILLCTVATTQCHANNISFLLNPKTKQDLSEILSPYPFSQSFNVEMLAIKNLLQELQTIKLKLTDRNTAILKTTRATIPQMYNTEFKEKFKQRAFFTTEHVFLRSIGLLESENTAALLTGRDNKNRLSIMFFNQSIQRSRIKLAGAKALFTRFETKLKGISKNIPKNLLFNHAHKTCSAMLSAIGQIINSYLSLGFQQGHFTNLPRTNVKKVYDYIKQRITIFPITTPSTERAPTSHPRLKLPAIARFTKESADSICTIEEPTNPTTHSQFRQKLSLLPTQQLLHPSLKSCRNRLPTPVCCHMQPTLKPTFNSLLPPLRPKFNPWPPLKTNPNPSNLKHDPLWFFKYQMAAEARRREACPKSKKW